jgi:rhodanese-related sulfurtransferase
MLTETCAVDVLLDKARAGLDRVEPMDLEAEMAAGALVVDTRPVEQRLRDGDLPGAVVLERNVLEWRLDPTSPWRIPEATDVDLRVIVVCDEGYSSSLAAATLRELGLHRATDLVDGYQGLLALERQRASDRIGSSNHPGSTENTTPAVNVIPIATATPFGTSYVDPPGVSAGRNSSRSHSA